MCIRGRRSGLEAACVLGEQARLDKADKIAEIDIGPTKMNPDGRECTRSLRCACDEAKAKHARRICPYHSLEKILRERDTIGLGPKDTLFVNNKGGLVSMKLVIDSMRLAVDKANVTEHSMRRAGAQYYTREGIELAVV